MKEPKKIDPFVARALDVLKPDENGRVGFITSLGLETYRNYPDPELQKALKKYLEVCPQQNNPATS